MPIMLKIIYIYIQIYIIYIFELSRFKFLFLIFNLNHLPSSQFSAHNFTIPANATIVIGVYHVHHNTKYWGPEPFSFNPDNFASDNPQKRHPYSFLPFSAGPRNCLGYKYAWMQIKIVMCHLLRKYKFTSPLTYKDIRVKVRIFVRLEKKCLVKIEKRVKCI